jgi:tripartite-type tricarboxylate transporter receptor subunit TctC
MHSGVDHLAGELPSPNKHNLEDAMAKTYSRAGNLGLTRRTVLKCTGAAAVAAPIVGWPRAARAAWPDRPVKLLVPFGPGGPADVIARLIGIALSDRLGQNFFVENKPGATGNIGVGLAARSEPDGYTILVTSNTFVINPLLFASVPYHPVNDFLPVAELASSPTGYAVHPALGVNTMAEFVAYAKERKGKVNYAHSGFGTPAHLAGEFLKIRAGIDMTAVPYNGGGPAVQALLTRSVELVSAALPSAHPQIVAGTLKGIAVTGEKRWFDLPDIPTMIEAGYPGFVVDTFTCMLAPAKTPQEIADILTKETLEILKLEDMQKRLRAVGFEATGGTPDALRSRIARELPLWGDIIAQAGIKKLE